LLLLSSAAYCAEPASPICVPEPQTGIEGAEASAKLLGAVGAGASGATAPFKSCDVKGQPFPVPNPNDGLKESPSPDKRCPAGSVRVGDFCMDQYIDALEEVLDDGSARAWSPFHNPVNPGNYMGKKRQLLAPARKYRSISAKGAFPQGHISEKQAEIACANHLPTAKRLCTAKEWLRACQGPGPDLRLFPYGGTKESDRKPGACNDFPRSFAKGEKSKAGPLQELFYRNKRLGDDLPDSPYGEFMDNACVTQKPGTINRGGDYPDCVTPEGVYDLVGNLHEWTSELQPNGNGVFRGGYFMDTYLNLPGCTYATKAHDQNHYEYSTGFRCCSDLGPDR
jgi:formylglycine-generating enzyme required for sulfatase activity